MQSRGLGPPGSAAAVIINRCPYGSYTTRVSKMFVPTPTQNCSCEIVEIGFPTRSEMRIWLAQATTR